ncbi:hypothetical protein AURDEDRAFT_130112 [Auricularia subglabra TFB-10046 SS5]|uniref:Uncharacterized protein n=1 Tax=Auricularia subglabra (strain TFB-10046 / SS5) TaxID=717982 RepID=J0WST2_AURST|nr:hypothetical protein AURDEDRAFT_130112 [Auricularia subglabra TFB-10046 SS5]
MQAVTEPAATAAAGPRGLVFRHAGSVKLKGHAGGLEGFHVVGLGHEGSWTPVMPVDDEMFWPPDRIAREMPGTVFAVCEDTSDAEAAQGLYFPQVARGIVLDRASREYKTGICYRYEWDASSREAHARRALNCAKHLALEPEATENGFPAVLRVPGQLQLTPGVPVCMSSKVAGGHGGEFKMTAAALHTPSSLERIPGMDGSRVRELVRSLARNVFGDPEAADERDRRPLYELNYKHNQRDTGSHASDFEGSYSMAVTVGEGQGRGHVQPAQQSEDPYMQERQQRLLCDSGELSPMVLESSLDRLTFEVTRSRGVVNNVPGFGHVSNVFFTGMQFNVSFIRRAGESLVESLGKHQGCNHIDPKDCTCGHTVFILLCTMPEGSDTGPFCFPEHGMYAHTTERVEGCNTKFGPVFAAFLTFKGRHLHGGFAPRAFWEHAFSAEGSDVLGVRIGLVNYGSGPALNRTGTFATGPPNGYSAAMQHSVRKERQRSLLEAGLTLFGMTENMATWTARENWYAAYNDWAIAGAMTLFLRMKPIGLRSAIEAVEYEDEAGRVRSVSARGVLDPTADHDAYIRQARLFAYVYAVSVHFNLGITKSKVKVSRALARSQERAKVEVPPFPVADDVRLEADADVSGILVWRSVNERTAFTLELGNGRVVWVYSEQWTNGTRKQECLSDLKEQGWETQFDVLESVSLETGAGRAEEQLSNIAGELDRMVLCEEGERDGDSQGAQSQGAQEQGTVGERMDDRTSGRDACGSEALGRPKRKRGGSERSQGGATGRSGGKKTSAGGAGGGRKKRKCAGAKGATTGRGARDDGDEGGEDDVDEKESVIEDASEGSGDEDERAREVKRPRPRLRPPPPVESVLDGMSWDGVLENMVAGRDGLTSVATVRRTTADVISQLAELGVRRRTEGVVHDAGAAMVSLHRAIDCAKAYSAAHAASVAGDIVVMSSKMALARSVVEIKNWILLDGLALAHKIFHATLDAKNSEPELKRIGVGWVDELAREIFRVASMESGVRSSAAKKAQAVRKAITLPAMGDLGAAPSEVERKLRTSARLVQKAIAGKSAVGEEDLSMVLACESDEDDYDDWDDVELDEDRSDDEDYTPHARAPESAHREAKNVDVGDAAQAECAGQPRRVRGKVDVALPSARDRGPHSALAKLRQKTFTLSFQAYGTAGQRRYNSLVTCFVETLFALLIEPSLRRANWHREFEFEGSERSREDGTHTTTQRLMGLIVAKGWMYQLLADSAGTETVWTHPDITLLTRRPENNFAKYAWVVTRMSDPIRSTYLRYVRDGVEPRLLPELAEFADKTGKWFRQHEEVRARLADIDNHFRYMADEFKRGQLQKGDPLLPIGFRENRAEPARLREGTSGGRSVAQMRGRKGAEPADLTSTPGAERLPGAGPPDEILTDSWLEKHSAFRPMENMCVYGTACREFTFDGGARIETLWADSVDDWLKKLLDEHGGAEALLSWEGMGDRVQGLEVKPFRGRGLALMQLCNELAELGMCREATVAEMGRWIWHNKDKGSFKGLQELGFGPLDDLNDVVHALQMWYDHLSESLTDDEKRTANFGVRFAENFLCKISRARRAHERMRIASSMKEWEDAYFRDKGEVAMLKWDGERRVQTCEVYVSAFTK